MIDPQTAQYLLTGAVMAAGIIYVTAFAGYRLYGGEKFDPKKYAETFGYVSLFAVAAYLSTGAMPDFNALLTQFLNGIPAQGATLTAIMTIVTAFLHQNLKSSAPSPTPVNGPQAQAAHIQQPKATLSQASTAPSSPTVAPAVTPANPNVKAAPAGFKLDIPAVWVDDPIDPSAINSLTDPHNDQNVVTVPHDQINTLSGLIGIDKINVFLSAMGLEQIGAPRLNVAFAFAWDPHVHPEAPLLHTDNVVFTGQTNLPGITVEKGAVGEVIRERYIPQYEYQRAKGPHTLRIAAVAREVSNVWHYANGSYTDFSNFPRVGDIVVRDIQIVIV
jgi:hypothetical protein